MGWRTWHAYEGAERERQREFIASLSPRDWQRLRIWQPCEIGILIWVVALMVLSFTFTNSAPVSPATPVIDGDTIRLHHRKPDVRLIGLNTPETRCAQCPAEEALGEKAAPAAFAIWTGPEISFSSSFRAHASTAQKEQPTSQRNYRRRRQEAQATIEFAWSLSLIDDLAQKLSASGSNNEISLERRLVP